MILRLLILRLLILRLLSVSFAALCLQIVSSPALLHLALAEEVETEISGVVAELKELRQNGGALRLAVTFTNKGAKEVDSDRFSAGQITIVDAKSKKKQFPIKDAEGHYIAGPVGDSLEGGRIVMRIPPGQSTTLWAYFEPLTAGSKVSVEMPLVFPFEDIVVTEGVGAVFQPKTAKTTPNGGQVNLVSAKRADQVLKVRAKMEGEAGREPKLLSPYFNYKNVYLFDPASKRKYPLMKDSEGLYQAQPLTVKMEGGSFIPNFEKPTLMSLTFQAPPDTVKSVDLVLPQFLPIEAVAIEGEGGADAGGIAAAGKTLGIEGALKELQAEVTPQEIKIDLSSDVLFDFDKADLKPAAEGKLQNVATVANSRPGSKVIVAGHTDIRGEELYNKSLSERRASSVSSWLSAHNVASDRLTAQGMGESQPVRSGDTEEDHQANRRVEIRIRN